MMQKEELLVIAARLIRIANAMPEEAEDLTVPYPRFAKLLVQKYPHSRTGHGAKRSLLDYNAKQIAAGETEFKITEGIEQSWRRDGEVPKWAYGYLESIAILPQRPDRSEWSAKEVKYLANLIVLHPRENYDQLAARCTRRFHRLVVVSAIKGVADRWQISKKDIAK